VVRDLLLYAAKHALQTKEQHQKYHYMKTAMTRLAAIGWNRKDKHDLMIFIERIVNLKDEALIADYTEYWRQLHEEGKMMYIPLMERKKAEELLQKGKTEGKAEGIAEGMAKGMAECQKNMAKSFLANGVSPEIVAKSSGLSLKKVLSLAN
jgi:predicted transposase YdaD